MTSRLRNLISIIVGLISIGFTILLYIRNPQITAPTIEWILFAFLITITTYINIPIGVGDVSLMPMVALSSTMVIGIIPTAVAVIFSDLLYGLIRGLIPREDKWEPEESGFSLAGTTTANITMHVFSVFAAGEVFFGFNGQIPLQSFTDFLIIVFAGLAYLSFNYLIAGLFLLMRSKAHIRSLINHLKRILVYEAIPIAFAPLLTLILIELGAIPFIMIALSLILVSNLLKDQAKDHQDLERRVNELSSLQAVGQSLSSSLDIKFIGESIYREVAKLMPANNFYLSLWNSETDEVSFPVIFENNQKREGQSRTSKQGLTEYVIQAKKPLLIEKNVKETCESLGIEHFGREALSWLGVPIMAGDQAVGIIAVQSYPVQDEIPKTYDQHNLEILNTIAAQASVAIQNAWLYTQTDDALAKRVQELNSILRSTSEGIMLLNLDLKVIEINTALVKMLETTPGTLLDKTIPTDKDNPLSALLIEDSILEKLSNHSLNFHQKVITIHGSREIPTERTISPVQDKSGKIIGWLCVFRDLTEQIRLENLKEDLTRMLVHDLRSPIVNIQGGLDMIQVLIEDNDPDALLEMVEISRKGSTRMLNMINELLNITKLESGEMDLQSEIIDLRSIFNDESDRFKPLIQQENLTLIQKIEENLVAIQGDKELLQRVLHNIIDNAIKYSPQGSQIEIWAKPDPEHKQSILVGVKDQGPGISKEEQSLLFEKYFTSQQTKSRRRGTGLGLYFCKLAVEAHRGDIWVESEIGKGSNFIFRLPTSQPAA
jgi:NtrC-family two-component system sensor histidine kinase KinB